jgi:hypothetical protein
MRTWQRFRALNAADRGLIREAVVWLVGVRIGLAALPFLTLRRTLSKLSEHDGRPVAASRESMQRVAWAVTSAAGHLPLSSTCLTQSLAAHAMLRRRGVDVEVRLGVRPPDGGPSLAAHAWIEHDGAVLLGQIDDLSDYAELQ